MKELSAKQLSDEFLQNLWMQRMPAHIQAVLSASSETLDQLAVTADKIAEVIQTSAICATSGTGTSLDPNAITTEILARQIEELTRQVSELSHVWRTPRFRSRVTSRSRKGNTSSNVCFCHNRFGDKARKCAKPCVYQQQKKSVIPIIAGMTEVSKKPSRLFLHDRKTGQKFLIDSGSEISVLPPSPKDKRNCFETFAHFAANNSNIPAYGFVCRQVNLGLRKPFSWIFVLADVTSPIIG
ncbi:hypothetical protein X975_19249, partial [Stegodyphus mimosarum]